ncbi:related to MTQ1 - S-adenosylmethionine-dependent methyltransferase [Melanopsichium pennsylvanicum]|uniref:Related to MTQ1 - S-adenosylmethionine-dependent methyltransferase n=1 Tax=Melanopsichium pennsylvanicum TaxID=63383 RepID=A0AAJ4XMN6_9BASI|nr:related to MTQ1 - S-adenosylmethionine-dependent methyltransferase [Melanopsichium pennsylvanicum]
MLGYTARTPNGTAFRTALAGSTKSIHFTCSTSSVTSSLAKAFFTSDDLLLKALRRRQEIYRLRQVSNKKADRIEAASLAKCEIRWLAEHVRSHKFTIPANSSLSPSSSSSRSKATFNRLSRRKIISMAAQMTRKNVPLSYLIGSIPFGNLPQELTVRPPILLPRPETEHWATQVAETLVNRLDTSQSIRVADLCTGSGCVALLVAHALRTKLGPGKNWKVVACDRSPLAVELAIENAIKLGLKVNQEGANLHIVQADIFEDEDMDTLATLAGGPFDLVLSNPPYIPRREYNSLSAEVKQHEDPVALIGERSVSPSISVELSQTPSNPAIATNTGESPAVDPTRQTYLDRNGLSFHARLAQLINRPAFSHSRNPCLPRLVAEYGKGQQKAVEKLHNELKAPKHRLAQVIALENCKLVVIGLGNATTHPETRHSIGQVVLDPLLGSLIDQDLKVRRRLREIRNELEEERVEAIKDGRKIDVDVHKDWAESVPRTFPLVTLYGSSSPSSGENLDVSDEMHGRPMKLVKVTVGKSGGWAATVSLLIPSSPQSTFLSSNSSPKAVTATAPSFENSTTIYKVEVLLFKPSQPMNLSGQGLKAFLQSHHPFYTDSTIINQNGYSNASCSTLNSLEGWRIQDDVLVLQDELDLEFGKVKMKQSGSARGHNGVRDIVRRLEIPDNLPGATTVKGGGGKGSEMVGGPKLARVMIGIGRPENGIIKGKEKGKGGYHVQGNNVDDWIPSMMMMGKSKKKPISIDKWVLSALTKDEIESCQRGYVLDQVTQQTLDWIRGRSESLVQSKKQHDRDWVESGVVKMRSAKDQFGVYRTIWVY